MINQFTTNENGDYFNSKMVYQNIKCYSKKLMHLIEEEKTIAEMAILLDIPPDRIHKTIEVNFHIHNITNEEMTHIQNMTLGCMKGRYKA